MKILLTVNKTLRRGSKIEEDGGHNNLYLPMMELGHDVYFYDTVAPEQRSFSKVIEDFKPDLIFCCLTNDSGIAPYEPWEEIQSETLSGRTKTFNWFCDDTWRFDNFSSQACFIFHACSTPEPSYLEKYKKLGYENIILGGWHSNKNFHPYIEFEKKNIEVSFVGRIDFLRKTYLNFLESREIPVTNIKNISREDLMNFFSESKIGLNFCVNPNDPERKTQMKARMFEIPAANSMLLTEYHQGIEEFFDIEKEIIVWDTSDELYQKIKFFLDNPRVAKKIAKNGYTRFLKEHDSKKRLEKMLLEINKL